MNSWCKSVICYPSPPAPSPSWSPSCGSRPLLQGAAGVPGARSTARGYQATVSCQPASPSPLWPWGRPKRSARSGTAPCSGPWLLPWLPWRRDRGVAVVTAGGVTPGPRRSALKSSLTSEPPESVCSHCARLGSRRACAAPSRRLRTPSW